MKTLFCVRCNKKHSSPWGWRHRKWHTEQGVVDGWGHVDSRESRPLEITTEAIKNDRKKYANDLVQPYLPDGSFNGKFRDLYPAQTKDYIKEGNVTKKQVKEARVYNDL